MQLKVPLASHLPVPTSRTDLLAPYVLPLSPSAHSPIFVSLLVCSDCVSVCVCGQYRVSLFSPGSPRTCYIAQAGLILLSARMTDIKHYAQLPRGFIFWGNHQERMSYMDDKQVPPASWGGSLSHWPSAVPRPHSGLLPNVNKIFL
jgi:hypothetical protein